MSLIFRFFRGPRLGHLCAILIPMLAYGKLMMAKFLRLLAAAAGLSLFFGHVVCGQDSAGKQGSSAAATPLTLEEVVKLTKVNLSEDLVIARIRRNAKPFDLNSDEIVELRRLGVSDTVVKYLIDPSQPYTPPAPAQPASVAPPSAPAKPPLDPLVLKVPVDTGIYSLQIPEMPVGFEVKPVVPSKPSGKLGSMLTGGLKKGHIIGSLAGGAAKARLSVRTTTLFARLGEKTPVEDLVLVMFTRAENHRDLDFGPKAAKPAFPSESVRQFESKDVGQGVVRLSFAPLAAGEYMFFILGSGDEKKGTLGKGWEFGVE